MNKLITWITAQLQLPKVRKNTLSSIINTLVENRHGFASAVKCLKDIDIPFTQIIQNGEREITIELSYCKFKLIWNENGKNLIDYRINIY